MKKVKKQFSKKKQPIQKPQEPSTLLQVEKKATSRKLLYISNILLSLIIVVAISLIIFLIILMQFVSLRNISGDTQDSINFSYFVNRPDQLSSSKALIVYDTNSHVSVLTKNENLRFAPASTAKIMTAIVVMESFSPDTILTADYSTVAREGSKMGLFLNEKMTVSDLVYGMLLPSGNDAAYLLASSYPGGEKAFVKRMNERAKELDLLNTHFVDPAGYEDDNYSTAYDMARLGAKLLDNEFLARVVSTKKIIIYNTDKTIPHQIKNLNELLEIPGVNGVKTGFTNEAEGVLVSSFAHMGKQYVMVVLRSKDRFQDTKELINGIINDLKNEVVGL